MDVAKMDENDLLGKMRHRFEGGITPTPEGIPDGV